MLPQPSAAHISKRIQISAALLICMVIGMLAFLVNTPVQASPAHQATQQADITLGTSTPQPPHQTPVSEDIIREGQPTGIIYGAIVIVLIILAGTAPMLLKRQ